MYGRFRDGANHIDLEAREIAKIEALEAIDRKITRLCDLIERVLQAQKASK